MNSTEDNDKEQSDTISALGDFLTTFIFSLIPVSDLVNCRLTSKRWHAIINSDALWIQKYIAASGISEGSAQIEPRPEGFYRKLFLFRFALEDVLDILKHNYIINKNAKYLHAIAKHTRAAALSSTFELNELSNPLSKTFLFNEVVQQSSDYLANTHTAANSKTLNAIATLYSPKTLRSVQIGIEYGYIRFQGSDETYGTANILALYHDSTEPEHLCKFITSRDDDTPKKEEYLKPFTEVGDAFVEPITVACEKLIKYLDFPPTATPRKLLFAIGKEIIGTWEADSDSDERSIHIFGRLSRNKIASIGEECCGLIHSLHAIEVVKERNYNPHIITLLENTQYNKFSESCGRAQPWLYGGEKDSVTQLCYSNKAEFRCTLPHYSTPELHTCMKNSMLDQSYFDPERSITIKVGDKTVIETLYKHENPFGQVPISDNETLEEIVKQLDFPGFTNIDFFNYLLVAGNLIDQFFIYGNREIEWWKLESLTYKSFVQTRSNQVRLPFYQHLKDEAEKLRQEIHWDGRQPIGFDQWEYVKDALEEDDCEGGAY